MGAVSIHCGGCGGLGYHVRLHTEYCGNCSGGYVYDWGQPPTTADSPYSNPTGMLLCQSCGGHYERQVEVRDNCMSCGGSGEQEIWEPDSPVITGGTAGGTRTIRQPPIPPPPVRPRPPEPEPPTIETYIDTDQRFGVFGVISGIVVLLIARYVFEWSWIAAGMTSLPALFLPYLFFDLPALADEYGIPSVFVMLGIAALLIARYLFDWGWIAAGITGLSVLLLPLFFSSLIALAIAITTLYWLYQYFFK